MKFLNRLRIWKELRALEAKARAEPSPSTFVDLGQVYINLGMFTELLAAAEAGIRLFPQSTELRKLLKFARKRQLDERIKEVRQRISRSPSARLYRDLALMYVELGDFGAVQGTCEEAIRRFPQDQSAYMVLARARLTNFYRDFTPRDGLEAVRCLQKVIELEPASAPAHRMIAELLYRVGAYGAAAMHLERLRQLMPDDTEVLAACDEVADKTTGREEDIDVLFHAVEAAGKLVNGQLIRELRSASGDDIVSIRESLAQIAEVAGVRKAAYIRGTKALVKGEIRDGRDAFLRVVRVVAKAAQRTSRRMDIGNFSKGVLDGDFGNICLCCYGDVIAAVLCDRACPTDRLLTDLQEIVAGSLSGRLEV